MNILLTGGRGFLGRHISAALVEQGFSVDVPKKRITPASIVGWDLQGCDAVVHLASRTPQSQCAEEIVDYDLDREITQRIAEKCLRVQTRFVFVSSANVYRESNDQLLENSPLEPAGPYARSKRESEECVLQLATTGLECFILRLFNAYGANQSLAYFVPYVMGQVRDHGVVELKCPLNVRDYIHVNDVKVAFLKTLQFDPTSYQQLSDTPVFNVGTGRGLNGVQLIQTVETLLGRELEVRLPDNEQVGNKYVASCEKSARVLGFESTITLERGLRLSFAKELQC